MSLGLLSRTGTIAGPRSHRHAFRTLARPLRLPHDPGEGTHHRPQLRRTSEDTVRLRRAQKRMPRATGANKHSPSPPNRPGQPRGRRGRPHARRPQHRHGLSRQTAYLFHETPRPPVPENCETKREARVREIRFVCPKRKKYTLSMHCGCWRA